ncbi:MAG: FAD-binding oxidoreductase, partial [Betaproteobacteria bacterium]|nr:FAD-binding oxidoreductase [Betaproteobacteria bacterium]
MNDRIAAAGLRREAPQALLQSLSERFGESFSTAQAVRQQHGRDESPFDVEPPSGVVFCGSTEDVADAVRLCAAHAMPVIAFGAGSSLEGQLLAVQGGITLDLTRMNRVLEVAAEDMLATVQAGVTRLQLNDELRHSGLFFPIDPGA